MEHSCKLSGVVEHDSRLRSPRAKFQHLIQIMNEMRNLLLWAVLVPGPGPKAGQGELFWERAPAPQLTTLGNEGSVPASGGGDGRPDASPCPEKSCGLPQPGRTPPWLKAGPTVLKPQASCRAERASLLGLEYSSSLRGSVLRFNFPFFKTDGMQAKAFDWGPRGRLRHSLHLR